MKPIANAPSRATGSTVLSFGLANIEVDLLTGSQESRVSRSQFVAVENSDGQTEYHPVGIRNYDKVTEAEVSRDAIVKGVQVDDQVVVISDEEMRSAGIQRGEAPVIGILKRSDLTAEQMRWLVPSKIYQVRVRAQRVGRDRRPNKAGEKLFTLMLRSLQRHDAWALLSLSVRDGGAKRFGLLDQWGRLSLLHYADELRQEAELPLVDTSSEEEDLMNQMMERMFISEVPMITDETSANLQNLIEKKLAGEDIAPVAQVAPTQAEQDVADLLRASIAQ